MVNPVPFLSCILAVWLVTSLPGSVKAVATDDSVGRGAVESAGGKSAAAVSAKDGAVLATGIEALGVRHAQAMLKVNFQRLDCENSGVVHVDEVDDHFAQIWLPADRDQNRSLSPSEYHSTHVLRTEEDTAAMFRAADDNSDGKVSSIEMRAHLKALMKLLDSDHDFEISLKDAGLPPDPYAKGSTPTPRMIDELLKRRATVKGGG